MSNILIIKHGSLGDIAQASGAIQDIYENYKDNEIYLLTTKPYFELFKKNPFIHEVILDKRLSKFNLIYLYSLVKKIKKLNIKYVFDLQNSSRTKFYKNIFFSSSSIKWSSSETTLPDNTSKNEFDKKPVLIRFNHQLQSSGVKTQHTIKPDFNWSCTNINHIKKKYNLHHYIVLFPFCSSHLSHKKWPYYNELIDLIKNKFNNKFKLVIAPGPSETNEAKKINAISILDNDKVLDILQLSSLIKGSSFVVANDTGPAHMAAHLNVNGLTLFGKHTSAYKVSIETKKFKSLSTNDLSTLKPEIVYYQIEDKLLLIN